MTLHRESGLSRGRRDQLQDHRVALARLAAPVLADPGESPFALMSRRLASGYCCCPTVFHQRRRLSTANAAVSWSMPTLTQSALRPRSYTPSGLRSALLPERRLVLASSRASTRSPTVGAEEGLARGTAPTDFSRPLLATGKPFAPLLPGASPVFRRTR